MNYPRPDSGLCKAVDSASLSNPAYETVWLNYWLAADLSCRAANVHQLVYRLDSSACMPTLTWEWGKTSLVSVFTPHPMRWLRRIRRRHTIMTRVCLRMCAHLKQAVSSWEAHIRKTCRDAPAVPRRPAS